MPDLQRNLADLVRDAASASPDKPALVQGSEVVTWGQLDQSVDDTARGLQGLGLVPGDRVALQLGNTLEFPTVWFAALRAGLVAVPVNTGYTAPELAWLLADTGARVLVAASADATVARALPLPPEHVVEPAALRVPGGAVESVGAGEDLALVLYTSGTSGQPRGACLPHRALLANLDQCSRIEPPVVGPHSVVLLVLPLFHVFGLGAALGQVAFHAATGVLSERFDPVETLELVRRHQVTTIVGAPPMYVAWSMLPDVGDAFSSVELALSGAAPLPPAVLHRVLDVSGHHVFEGYGLTETAPVLTSTLMSEVAKPGSIGRPVPGVQVRLVDEAGRPVEDGDPGEVVVRGDNLFTGYWPDGAGGPDEHGWWPTGDVAVCDDEGDLHLVDRRREMVLVSGFNVYPREVEDVLLAHPLVAEAAVLGIAHPYTGESVKALVVPVAGATLTADEVIAFAATRLARFKCPTSVDVVAELPHTATGKISKGRLREQSAAARG